VVMLIDSAQRPGKRGNGRGSARPSLDKAGFGPLLGLRDSRDPQVSKDPRYATAIENLYPIVLNAPSIFVGLPGFTQMGAQGGALSKRVGQACGQFTTDAGVKYRFRIVGGQGIQTYNFGTDTWTTVVSVANLTTATITLSETDRVFWVKFHNKVVFNDGTNRMWTWDGQAGTAGLAVLTNAPIAYGQPTVYYAKLFIIKASERNVICWSEEQDETLGYEMAAYNNTWAVIQSSQGPIYAICGTNEALYIFRESATFAIYGPVVKEFQTDGVRAGIDETIGTKSPAGVAYRGKRLFFPDAKARPMIVAPGTPLKECYHDINETLMSIDVAESTMADAVTLYDPRLKLILFVLTETGQSTLSTIIAFNPELDIPVSVFRGFNCQAIAQIDDADGTPTIMHLDDAGYAYVHGQPEGSSWDFEKQSGTIPIRHTVDGPHLACPTDEEKSFLEANAILRADADATSITLRYETPYGDSTAQTASVTGSLSRWDEFNWDEGLLSFNTIERKVPFGLSATARWLRPRLSHEVLGEQFGFAKLEVGYVPAGHTTRGK
jgi:hypothetical protein